MNDFFSEQKDILVAIKHEISLLYQQIDYLIRHEKPLDILDLDVMMNRTHTIYDHLCSVDAGVEVEEAESGELRAESEDEELDVDPNLIRAAFGIAPEEESEKLKAESGKLKVEKEESEPEPELEPELEIEPEPEIALESEPELEPEFESEPEPEMEPESEPELELPIELPEEDDQPHDDFGFIFKMEDEKPQKADETEKADETVITTDEPSVYEPEIFDNLDVKDDASFELDMPETLGEKLQHQEDHSLAAKLQNRSVNDLKNAIGINDKFLFVNELFGGSMDKYNKSIENLNDLKTLNGALIYMNELRIDLAWNTSNEAYKKLLELVHQKFQN